MFGIQLTGQCVAKGRWRSGSVINYRQISSYKDPSPPGAPFFMASGKPHKSVAESPPRVTLTASIIVLHGLVHPLSACPKLNCLQKQRWMFPTHSSGVVNLPLFLPFPQLHNHFYLLSFLPWCMHNTCLQWLRKELLSLVHPSHAFHNAGATVPLPLAFPPHDIFSLSSINQTPRPAELKKQNKAFEENGEGKRGFCTERFQDSESFLLTAVIRVWDGHLLWRTFTGA